MTRGKFVVFAALAGLLALAGTGAALLAADLYLHYRNQVNVWGYRGPAVGPKQPGESRLAVLGESTAWGYGVRAEQAFPALLEGRLAERRRQAGRGPVSVVNLAYNNEGALSFTPTLRDYAYLGYDAALLYTGYNDLAKVNRQVVRSRSRIFRLTGYWPLIPVIVPDHLAALRSRLGWRAPRRPVFKPDASASQAQAAVRESLGRTLGGLSGAAPAGGAPAGCGGRWAEYCAAVGAAIEAALARGCRVVVVTQPYISDLHIEQQGALQAMLRARFGADGRVRHVNLGALLDLRDPALAFDGMHLTPRGNARVAEALVQPVLEVLE